MFPPGPDIPQAPHLTREGPPKCLPRVGGEKGCLSAPARHPRGLPACRRQGAHLLGFPGTSVTRPPLPAPILSGVSRGVSSVVTWVYRGVIQLMVPGVQRIHASLPHALSSFLYWLMYDLGAQVRDCWASQVLVVVKKPPASGGDPRHVGSISGWGRSPRGGHGNSLQCFWASLGAHRVQHLPARRETRVQSLSWEGLLEKGMATHSSILAWRIPWTEEPGAATVHGVSKSRTRRSDFHSLTQCPAWAGGVFPTEPPGKQLSYPLCY